MNTGYNLDLNQYNKILNHSDKSIKNQQQEIKLYDLLIEQLVKQNGKQITKRVMNYISLDGFYPYYTKRYDHFYIGVHKGQWSTEIPLAEYKETKLSIEFMKKNRDNRIKAVNKDLETIKNITQIIIQYNTALECYKAAEEQLKTLPGWFSLDRF